jgi:hypothetical protein
MEKLEEDENWWYMIEQEKAWSERRLHGAKCMMLR